jgi:L-fuconolactonase
MPLFDAHVHIWTHDPAHPFAPGATPPPSPALPDTLLALMDAHGVEGAVLVQPIQYRWDNRYVAAVLRAHPRRFAGVCRVDPQDPEAPDHLRRWVEEEGFQGFRISPSATPEGMDWFDGPLMDPLLARGAELGVPMLLLTGPLRLPRLSELLDRHPTLDVCVDHMADVDPVDEAGIAGLLELARHPTVRVKLSHAWSLSREAYPWRDCWGLLARIHRAFGARRLMWCSDWPVSEPHTAYRDTLRMLEEVEDPESGERLFPGPDLAWIRGGTAREWWRTRA